ncbi:MAG: ATP-binding protein [Brumimicrobium sp.]|nr:ATP-binding protein [Brumimicrobium sp.]
MISILLSWTFYNVFFNVSPEAERKQFQESIYKLQASQQKYAQNISRLVATSTVQEMWHEPDLKESRFNVNIFYGDSLVFWNNNSVPVNEELSGILSDLSGTEFLELSNGYYLLEKREIHDVTLLISSKIKHDYYYENTSLKNTLVKGMSLPNEIEIFTDFREGTDVILDRSGDPLFYISLTPTKVIDEYEQLFIFLLYAFGLFGLSIALVRFLLPFATSRPWLIFLFPVLILALRWLSIEYRWMRLFNDFKIFNPKLYASSELFPNLGSLFITVGCFLIISLWIYRLIINSYRFNKRTWLHLLFYLLLYPYAFFISWLFESLVLNSTISLVINEVFSLSVYSFIALFIIASVFLSYYVLIKGISIYLIRSEIKLNHLATYWFTVGVIYLLLQIFIFDFNIYSALWPTLLNGILFYIVSRNIRIITLKYKLLILLVISFYAAFILFESNQSNEYQKRELYANQLVTDRDPATEIEYLSTIDQLKQNAEFLRKLDEPEKYSASDYVDAIELCCFKDYWERYEMSFFLFDTVNEPLVNYISGQTKTYQELKNILKEHGTPSTITEELFYIEDYFDRLSYIAHSNIVSSDGDVVELFILFRSKKIPEHIGFPRLLMNETTYALEDLEDYSIARYSEGSLVMRFGSFNFPTKLNVFTRNHGVKNGFVESEKTSHFIYQEESGQTIIISKPKEGTVEKLTTFSYLFLFFGIYSLVFYVVFSGNDLFSFRSLQLSVKIQLVLIGIVVISFVVFAFVAGTYTRKQYLSYSHENLKEKVYSVEIEVSQKLGDKDELDPTVLGNYMKYILKKFSNVFVTDINLYDRNGYLLASSQPRLYDKGISSGQMNPSAFTEMVLNKKSEYIHQESIGELQYLSAYLPFKNDSGKLLGYLNLQHFAKQNAYEHQINDFIVAIINIAVLLLVITVVIAIFVASWITTPLRFIQESFRNVELGKQHQPIAYKGDDEIGALVKDYNDKLAELELKAMQLARSERETAWREMAKQVAHEIKNPLTPMRLSLQHFQRSFDPNSPNAQEKINRIANSLVEQIDILTKIANEFSNFAKMPKANEQALDLIPLLENVVNLYDSDEVNIRFETESSQAIVFVDKDLILRVFNNLIKNAVQAVDDGKKAEITIRLESLKKSFLITVSDNGNGIPRDIQNKIFVPNFTTKSTGAGLGLAMVKQIINNHNGDIWFETKESLGTTFFIQLPEHGGSNQDE